MHCWVLLESFQYSSPSLDWTRIFADFSFAFINFVRLLVLLDHFSISAEAFLCHWDGEIVEVWRQNVAGMLRLEDREVVVGTQLKGQFQKKLHFMPLQLLLRMREIKLQRKL